MSTLLEKPISVNRILVTSIDHAKAIEDPARAKIVQMLYNKNLNAEQITLQLKKEGHKKAVTTTSCLLYTSPSPRDLSTSRMPSSA